MGKTLGEINCEAYSNEISKAEPGHKAWQAAAEAVVKHLGEVPCGVDCGRARAVIEAAKAWLHSASPRDERDHVYCRHRLGEAIEALEEVGR